MKLIISAFLAILAFKGCFSQSAQKPQDGPYQYKAASADGTGKFYKGREIAHVMGAAGAAWLERIEREQEEAVSKTIAAMPLKPGDYVADIGAGTGYYTFKIAPELTSGKVFAVELQPELIEYLNNKKAESNTQNLTVVKSTEKSVNLPQNSIDLAFMVDVYHELAYPQEVLQSIYKALKPGGKLLLLEYRAEDSNVPIKTLHKMSVTQVNKELNANGFKLSDRKDFLPWQHFLLYEKQ